MCDTAMHNEALRKERVIERKRLAQEKLKQQQVVESAMYEEGPNMALSRAANQTKEQFNDTFALHAEQRRLYNSHGKAYDQAQYDHSRNGPTRPIAWNHIERQLRHEEKVLRNHNLYMGPVAAFKELHGRDMLQPKQ